ncbi:hypothetical protein Tco_0938634, partial [Tanacetum coccineum]
VNDFYTRKQQSSSSPFRRNRNPKDLEAGSGEGGEEYDAYDPFDIVRMKSASVDRLERCTNVLFVVCFQGTTSKAVVQPDLTNLPEKSRKQSYISDRKDCWNLVSMELHI